jgi:hypothetical protein
MYCLRAALSTGALMFAACSGADAQESRYTVIGAPGLVTCERWLVVSDNDTLRVRDDDDIVEEQVKAWVAGFLSAYNRYGRERGNVAEGRTADDLIGWADRFCEANPDATMAMLAETMINELNAARR